MSAAARSLFVFGVYAVLAGLGLAFVPSLVLGPLGFPPPADNWVRVLGVLVICVGFYHTTAARHELIPYVRASITIRMLFAAALVVLVLVRVMPRPLLVFAAIDALAAVWTAMALKPQRSAGSL